jgi:hypothetical protein
MSNIRDIASLRSDTADNVPARSPYSGWESCFQACRKPTK